MGEKRKRGRRAKRRTDPKPPRKVEKTDFIVLENVPVNLKAQFRGRCAKYQMPMTKALHHLMEQCVYENKPYRSPPAKTHRTGKIIRCTGVSRKLKYRFRIYCAERDISMTRVLVTLMEEAVFDGRSIKRSKSLQNRFDQTAKRKAYYENNKKNKKTIQ